MIRMLGVAGSPAASKHYRLANERYCVSGWVAHSARCLQAFADFADIETLQVAGGGKRLGSCSARRVRASRPAGRMCCCCARTRCTRSLIRCARCHYPERATLRGGAGSPLARSTTGVRSAACSLSRIREMWFWTVFVDSRIARFAGCSPHRPVGPAPRAHAPSDALRAAARSGILALTSLRAVGSRSRRRPVRVGMRNQCPSRTAGQSPRSDGQPAVPDDQGPDELDSSQPAVRRPDRDGPGIQLPGQTTPVRRSGPSGPKVIGLDSAFTLRRLPGRPGFPALISDRNVVYASAALPITRIASCADNPTYPSHRDRARPGKQASYQSGHGCIHAQTRTAQHSEQPHDKPAEYPAARASWAGVGASLTRTTCLIPNPTQHRQNPRTAATSVNEHTSSQPSTTRLLHANTGDLRAWRVVGSLHLG